MLLHRVISNSNNNTKTDIIKKQCNLNCINKELKISKEGSPKAQVTI